jgi:hypothetical protein
VRILAQITTGLLLLQLCSCGDKPAPAPSVQVSKPKPAPQTVVAATESTPAPDINVPPPGAPGTPAAVPAVTQPVITASTVKAGDTLDLAKLTEASKAYGSEHGSFPKNFEDVIKEHYLDKLPEVPTGKRLVIDAKTGQVTLVETK